MQSYLKVLIFLILCKKIAHGANVSSPVFFQIHPAGKQPFNLTSNVIAARQACPSNVRISWIIHGWKEGLYKTEWVTEVINSTLKFGGGCVIFMDYSFYAKQAYGELVTRYELLRNILASTVAIFGNYNRMHFFGFSFGSRLAMGCGNVITSWNNGIPQIAKMDLCDPAGPEFELNSTRRVPAQKSAKNVACINTSENYGTTIYDCHQNYKMGHCGRWQDGQGPFPKGSHGLCPYFYNSAFYYNFVNNELYKKDCIYPFSQVYRPVNATCLQNMIMGYRNRMFCIGDILIPTTKCTPYVYNGKINNYPKGKTAC